MSISQARLPVLMSSLGASFQCTACGDCCRGWAVNVDVRTYHGIVQALTQHPHPEGIGPEQAFALTDQQGPRSADAYARLKQRPDGSCVFLMADNRCYLHTHFGPELKPVACRAYPFRPVQRPGAVHAPASLDCTSLLAQLSALTSSSPDLVTVDQPGVSGLAGLAFDRYSPGAYTKLGGGRQLPVEVLTQVEERLVGLLHDERLPVPVRLLGLRLSLDALIAVPDERISPRLAQKALDQATQPAALLAAAERLPGDVRQHLGLLLQAVQSLDAGVRVALLSRQQAAFGLAGDHTLPERDRLVLQRYQHGFAFSRQDLVSVLLAYVSERVRASNLTLRHGLSGTVQALLFGAALVRFFAVGLAAQREGADGQVTRADLAQAIVEVERHFFHNLRVMEMFAEGAPPWPRSTESAAHLLLPRALNRD